MVFDGKIEHFIVLMLENRSYDLMLGDLPGKAYDGAPFGAQLPYDSASGVEHVTLRRGAPPDVFHPDPAHGFDEVNQQIYGQGADLQEATMSGFARSFSRVIGNASPAARRARLEEYGTLYGDGRLPVLQRLAKEYGVCTHWFSSVPSSTTPNRMFAHAGTSAGVIKQGAFWSRLQGKTIFDHLGRAPDRWSVFYHDIPHLWLLGDAWLSAFNGQFKHIGKFRDQVQQNTLPTYSFIEPRHVIPPWNSQHPAAGVSYGEELIARVYDDLTSNPAVFQKSLLLVVYDEHGGFYDHVIPPGHAGWREQNPGVNHTVVRPESDPKAVAENGFDFTKLGPRVPAVVISPWIEKGSTFGWKTDDVGNRVTFDHTSILSTVQALTGVGVASERARKATSLEVAINRSTPRIDSIGPLLPGFRHADYSRGAPSFINFDVLEQGLAHELLTTFGDTAAAPPTIDKIEALRQHFLRVSGG